MSAFIQEEIDDKMFDFMYGCAMHDAVLQQSFPGTTEGIGDVVGAKVAVRDYIDAILKGSIASEEAHTDFFIKTAHKVCDEINFAKPEKVKGVFNFGNAQKLINMTVKHFYVVCYQNPQLRNKFKYCHCPMDSVMLGKIWEKYRQEIENIPKRSRKESNLGKDFLAAWGCEDFTAGYLSAVKIDSGRYWRFQAAIKELIKKGAGEGTPEIFPVEFDYLFWKNK